MKIKILRGLATKIACSKQHRKAVELLLYLMALDKEAGSPGRMPNTKAQHLEVCKAVRICYNTLLPRLKLLSDCGLLKVKQGSLYLPKWGQIADHFGIEGRARFYYVDAPTGKGRIEHVLETLAMREVLNKSEAAFYFYLNKYPDVKEAITRVASGGSREQILYSQLENFLLQYRDMDAEDKYLLNLFRADNTMNYKYWSRLFAYCGIGSMAYKKRKLEALGLITIERERCYELPGHTTKQSRTCKMLGNTHWAPQQKVAVLTLPDEIFFNSLNHVR